MSRQVQAPGKRAFHPQDLLQGDLRAAHPSTHQAGFIIHELLHGQESTGRLVRGRTGACLHSPPVTWNGMLLERVRRPASAALKVTHLNAHCKCVLQTQ